MSMHCPKCKTNLTNESYEGVEIDRCQTCKGTWLDSGEITKIIDILLLPWAKNLSLFAYYITCLFQDGLAICENLFPIEWIELK